MKLVNFALLKHPLNWLTVLLMLFFAAIAGTLILELIDVHPATGPNPDAGFVSSPPNDRESGYRANG